MGKNFVPHPQCTVASGDCFTHARCLGSCKKKASRAEIANVADVERHSNVTTFPRFKLTDVAASLRTLADEIESGKRPVRRAVVCMEREDGSPDYCAIGQDFPRYHAIGICHYVIKEIAG